MLAIPKYETIKVVLQKEDFSNPGKHYSVVT
jgi:hypothetical protein